MTIDKNFANALKGCTYSEASAVIETLGVPRLHLDRLMISSDVEMLWKELSYLGSNNVAYLLRGFEGVDYNEILYDVCTKMKVEGVDSGMSLEAATANEEKLLEKIFADAMSKMSPEEREQIFIQLGISSAIPKGASMFIVLQVIKSLGGFGLYQMSVIVANLLARAILGRGLTFAANAAITRVIGGVLGPVGWIASGAWLGIELAGPAYRKTVPAIIHIATLRQLSKNRLYIGVVGKGSSGKDSLLKALFGIDTKNVNPIPGSTASVEPYSMPDNSIVRVLNFPGFGDFRNSVDKNISENEIHPDLFLYVFDMSQVPQREDVSIYQQFKSQYNVIPVLNKSDKIDDDDYEAIISRTKDILGISGSPILTCFKPSRIKNSQTGDGITSLQNAINEWCTQKKRGLVFEKKGIILL